MTTRSEHGGYAWVIAAVFLAAVAASGCGDETCRSVPKDALGEPTDWEADFARKEAWPSSPDAKFVTGEEDVPLAYREWEPSGWTGEGPVVVFIHGSSAHSGEYTVIGEQLAEAGVFARLIDLRGHGLSTCRADGDCSAPGDIERTYTGDGYYPGRIGDARDPNQYLRDLGRHLADLRDTWPEARLLLAGHSSGAGVVSRFVEHGGGSRIDGTILLAPFHHPDQPQNDLAEYECGRKRGNGYAMVDMGALGDALRGNVHRYVLRFHKPETYRHPLDTLRNTYTAMRGMQTRSPGSFVAGYELPVLWIAAEHDALLDLDEQRRQFERLPGGDQFVVVEATSHVGLGWSTGVADLMAQWATDPTTVTTERIQPQSSRSP